MLGRLPLAACLIWAWSTLGCAQAERRTIVGLRLRVKTLNQQLAEQRAAAQKLAGQLEHSRARIALLVARTAPPNAPRPAAKAPLARRPAPPAVAVTGRLRRQLPVVKIRPRYHVPAPPRWRPPRRAKRRGPKVASGRKRWRREKRPVLRLFGVPTPARPTAGGRRRPPLSPMPVVRHRLPVVPLPRIPVHPPSRPQRTPADAASASPLTLFREARSLRQRGQLAEAARAFSRFAKTYPKHKHADNALYWLADCFERRGQLRKAAWVLRRLLKEYAAGNKASAAMLSLAGCEGRLGKKAKRQQILAQVLKLYPGTAAAAKAAVMLSRKP